MLYTSFVHRCCTYLLYIGAVHTSFEHRCCTHIFCTQVLYISIIHTTQVLYISFVHRYCTHIFCTQVLNISFVHRCCTHILYTGTVHSVNRSYPGLSDEVQRLSTGQTNLQIFGKSLYKKYSKTLNKNNFCLGWQLHSRRHSDLFHGRLCPRDG